MEWSKIIGFSLMFGYWALLLAVLGFVAVKTLREKEPIKQIRHFFTGDLYSAEAKFGRGDFLMGGFWVCLATWGMYVVFQYVDYTLVLGQAFADLFKVAVLVASYYAAKHFSCFYSKRWANYLLVYVAVSVLTFLSWTTYGTHLEDGDPIFGGGTRVTDFTPTKAGRSNHAGDIFFKLLPVALFGVYRGQNSQDRKVKEVMAAMAIAERRSKVEAQTK
jgi:hypothetical protein